MKLREGFLIHDMDGGLVMVAAGAAAQRFAGMARANGAASVILKSLMQDTDEESIVRIMAETYDAPEEVLRADVQRVLVQLRSIGALEE